MPKVCENINTCGFLKKYGNSHRNECTQCIKQYCAGYKMAQCSRKRYLARTGKNPPDDLRPDGHSMVYQAAG